MAELVNSLLPLLNDVAVSQQCGGCELQSSSWQSPVYFGLCQTCPLPYSLQPANKGNILIINDCEFASSGPAF